MTYYLRLLAPILLTATLFACRSEEEEELIATCTAACEKEHDSGCGSGSRADCEANCEEECDNTDSDCYEEQLDVHDCNLASTDICTPNCSDEETNLLACAVVDAITPFSANSEK